MLQSFKLESLSCLLILKGFFLQLKNPYVHKPVQESLVIGSNLKYLLTSSMYDGFFFVCRSSPSLHFVLLCGHMSKHRNR